MKFSSRKLINNIHLWIGLPSALILFVVCLSGSLYVFNEDISRWIDKDKYTVQQPAGAAAQPVEQLKFLVEEQQKGIVTAVQIPESADEAWVVTVKKNEKERGQTFIVDPYTGKVKGSTQTSSFKFFNTVMKLHRWLLMDKEIGKWITGVAAFMFLLLEITGLILWVPRKLKTWKSGLTVKSNAGWKRKNFDLHKAVGFYTFIFITIMAITGPYLGLDWYKKSVNNMLGVKASPKPPAEKSTDTTSLPINTLLQKADSIYAYAATTRINFAEKAAGPITIMKVHKGFSSSSLPDRVTLNASTGAVIKMERFADKKFGEKIAASMKSIHTGELFGGFTKIIWFIACFIATFLPVTGVMIWLNKRPTSKKRASLSPSSQHRAYRLPTANN